MQRKTADDQLGMMQQNMSAFEGDLILDIITYIATY